MISWNSLCQSHTNTQLRNLLFRYMMRLIIHIYLYLVDVRDNTCSVIILRFLGQSKDVINEIMKVK